MKEPKTAFAYFQQDFIARFRHILKECTNYWIPVQRTWLELVSKWQKCRLRDSGRGPNGILASGLFLDLIFILKLLSGVSQTRCMWWKKSTGRFTSLVFFGGIFPSSEFGWKWIQNAIQEDMKRWILHFTEVRGVLSEAQVFYAK